MPTYDYRCENGHVTEFRRGRDCVSLPCPVCTEEAKRVPFYASVVLVTETGVGTGYGRYRPVGSETRDKNGRTRVSLFQEASAELSYAHKKREEEVGQELPRRGYYKEGVKRAQALDSNVGGGNSA